MITSRTTDKLLNQSNLNSGPGTKIDDGGLENYKKRASSQESIDSQISVRNNNEKKINVNKLPIIVSKLGRGKSARAFNQKNIDSPYRLVETQKKTQKKTNSMFKTVLLANIVDKFKNNLFSISSLLQNQQKKFYEQYDQKLIEEEGTSSNTIFKNDTHIQEKFPCFIGFILKLLKIKKENGKIISKQIKWQQYYLNYFFIWECYSLIMQLFSLWYFPFIISFGLQNINLKGLEVYAMTHVALDILSLSIYQSILLTQNLDDSYYQMFEQLFLKFLSLISWILIIFEYYKIYILREILMIGLTILTFKIVKQNYDKQAERLFLQGHNLDYLDLLTLFITIIFLAHYIGCSWFYVGELTYEDYGSWLEFKDLKYQNIFTQYIYSFYWATTTIGTVGYGDITPKNQYEILFSTFIMLVSSCMFAYSINQIGLILNNIYESNQKQKRSLALVNQYLKKQQTHEQLQNRVRSYFKFSNVKEILDNYEETQNLLNSLPSGLKNELQQDFKENIIKKIKILGNYFSKTTNQYVSDSLIKLKVTPEDVLYQSNDQNERNLYYINFGEIMLIEKQSKKILRICKAGETFGEYQFFTNQNTKEIAVCSQFSELCKIDRDAFLKIIKQNSKDFQIFHKIKDDIIFKQDFTMLQQNCQICQAKSHSNLDCRISRFIPNVYITILKHNHSSCSKRKKFLRSNFKFQTLLQQNNINKAVEKIKDDNNLSLIVCIQDSQNHSNNFELISLRHVDPLNRRKKELTFSTFRRYSVQTSMKIKDAVEQQNFLRDKKGKATIYLEEKMHQRSLIKLNQQINQLDQLKDGYFANTLEDFDISATFTDYFPHNNIQNVIKIMALKQILNRMNVNQSKKMKKGRSYQIND